MNDTELISSPAIINASPLPEKEEQEKLDFPDAIRAIINGSKVTKLEWGTKDIYGLLKDKRLMIHINGKDNIWEVAEEDLLGTDWVVIESN